MYYTVIKNDRHLRTRGKRRKHESQANVFHIYRQFSNDLSVLSQCNTRLSLLNLLYDIDLLAQNNKTRFFYVLYSDKTQVFDQSERAQGPFYVINRNRTKLRKVNVGRFIEGADRVYINENLTTLRSELFKKV